MTVVDPEDPAWKSKTSQEFKAAADINNIVKTWTATGVCPSVTAKEPFFVDTTEIKSFEQQVQSIIDVQNAFDELGPDIRKKFDNDPVKLVSWLADEKNREEATRLGFFDVKQAEAVAPQGQQVGEASDVKLDEKKGS